jgi:hypothetical protein
MISSVTMILLLLFLTTVNQFIYSDENGNAPIAWNSEESEPGTGYPSNPAGPDEKSPDVPVSFNEEYIHDHHSGVNPFWANALFEHMIHEADKLRFVHSEIHSPPPNA